MRRDYTSFVGFVGKDAVAIGALLGAIAGAALGAYVQNAWTSEPTDADDFGKRLAKLEAEIEELELLQRERKRKGRQEPAAPVRPAEAPQTRSEPQPQPTRPQASQRQRLQPETPRSQPLLEVRGKPPEQQYLPTQNLPRCEYGACVRYERAQVLLL